MDFGLGLHGSDPDWIAEVAPEVERLGFRTAWSGDHVVGFSVYSDRYPYTVDGRYQVNDDPGRLGGIDSFQKLLIIGMVTQRLRVGTGILLVPQRNPVYTAQSITTLDIYTGGRVDFGVGVGWSRQEYEAVNVPFEERDARCREHIGVMKALWTSDPSSFSGELYQLPECRQHPKPLQTPHPPLLFGGNGGRALDLVADLGEGWFGWGLNPDQTAEKLTALSRRMDDRGRSVEELRILVGCFAGEINKEDVRRYEEAGVHELVIGVLKGREDAKVMIELAYDVCGRLM